MIPSRSDSTLPIPPRKFPVSAFYESRPEELGLSLVAGKEGMSRTILEPAVNRPGLLLAGFSQYFAEHRIQVMGKAEVSYLASLTPEQRLERYRALLDKEIPCVVFCRGQVPDSRFLGLADAARVPVFRCRQITMHFLNRATLLLQELAAPSHRVQGSMVDILGIGVLITGEPGIGKSECAVGLIERGYSLVADDFTALRLHAGRELIATAPDQSKNYMEVRGIGLVNVLAMFGVKAMRTEKRLDLVVKLQRWQPGDDIERIGQELPLTEYLGVKVPYMIIPVGPGRDVARLVEVAAFHMKLRIQGYNPAESFNLGVIAGMQKPPPTP